MFKRIIEAPGEVRFEFEGETVTARAGESVAAALLAHGVRYTRTTPVSGEPRTAYCHIGVCFECLVEIDGRANRQACMTEAREGMKVRRQMAPRQNGKGGGQ